MSHKTLQGSGTLQLRSYREVTHLTIQTADPDIVVTSIEQGYPVKRYIQDRTVIEDTESSVDLAGCGWQLYNYPERLTYSATPPDFGSLIIQRRRWANGGTSAWAWAMIFSMAASWAASSKGA